MILGAALAAAALAWTPLHPATLPRTEVAAARIGHHVYVLGGFVPPDRTSAAVERYDLAADRWTRVRGLPFGLNHASAVAYRGRLYVVGGYRAAHGLTQESAALLRYDPGTNRWTRLRNMPTARAAMAVGVVGGRLYAAGGAAGGRALRTLESYDFATNRWSRRRPMGVAREHLAGAALGGRFYALAGRAGGMNFAVAERYDPARDRWERLPDMRKPRGGIAAATPGGRVVVVGGEEAAGTIKEVEAFDPARRRWTALPDLPTPRHGLGAVAYRGAIYVLEGGTSPGFSFSAAAERLVVSAARRASTSFGLSL
jgi:N-acetylneuraminic acid mutarotase